MSKSISRFMKDTEDLISKLDLNKADNFKIDKLKEKDTLVTADELHDIFKDMFPDMNVLKETEEESYIEMKNKITTRHVCEVMTLKSSKERYKNITSPICPDTTLGIVIKETDGYIFKALEFNNHSLHHNN